MIRTMMKLSASAAALVMAIPAAAQEQRDLPEIVTGTWGVDTSQIDPALDPGDDFFAYVNSKWIAANPIPPQYTSIGVVTILRDDTRTNVRKLVDKLIADNPAPGSNERRVVDAYQAYMDVAAIDAAGMAPAQPYLQRIASAPDLASLMALSVEPGFPTLVGPGVTIDPKDPTQYAVSIGFNGMGLPGREYYLEPTEKNLAIQKAYRNYLSFVLGKAGYTDPVKAAEAVYAFEHKVAELEWAPQALRNRDLTYNLLTADELRALSPGFPTDAMLAAGKVTGQATFLANQMPPTDEEITRLGLTPTYLEGIGGGLPAMMNLLADTDLATIKAYLAAHFIDGESDVLPSDIDNAHFELFDKLIAGRQEQQPRWKRAIGTVEAQIGELLGASYVENYFPATHKAAMTDLIANLTKAMELNLRESKWMSDETKPEALKKLAAFDPRIGHPDTFKTYDGLVVTAGQPLANAIEAARWGRDYNLSRLGKPVDRKEWPYVPQTVNASYSPSLNSITFPAGFLQPPMFNISADPAVNYGAIGYVIGHEIGHGFDDQGSKYDATGALRNWWGDEDRKAFEALAQKLVEQYDSYCPLDEGKFCVNGRLTLGENIGDLAGIEMAYRAYKLSLDGKEAPVIDGLTGDQRFFLSFAQMNRTLRRDESLRNQILTDPHSPDQYRVNGIVRNVDAWYKAFNVTPDDDLYLPPEERVNIW
jgi:putative endopeptidase